MSVTTECSCGRKLKARDEAAGRTGSCPACGEQVTFPILDDQIADFLSEGTSLTEAPPTIQSKSVFTSDDDGPATKTCRFCGEEVLKVAIKCKHCGEFFNQAARPSSGTPQKWNPGVAVLLSFLVPGIG